MAPLILILQRFDALFFLLAREFFRLCPGSSLCRLLRSPPFVNLLLDPPQLFHLGQILLLLDDLEDLKRWLLWLLVLISVVLHSLCLRCKQFLKLADIDVTALKLHQHFRVCIRRFLAFAVSETSLQVACAHFLVSFSLRVDFLCIRLHVIHDHVLWIFSFCLLLMLLQPISNHLVILLFTLFCSGSLLLLIAIFGRTVLVVLQFLVMKHLLDLFTVG